MGTGKDACHDVAQDQGLFQAFEYKRHHPRRYEDYRQIGD